MAKQMNMQQMMKQARKMQEQLAQAEERLAQTEISSSAGGGMVKVTATGDQHITSIKIDPEAVDPEDVEMLQDMVLAAVNDALKKGEETREREMSKVGGAGMGGMF